jgi:S1-C subfamily serine protease
MNGAVVGINTAIVAQGQSDVKDYYTTVFRPDLP